jgi:hypothetical protein
VRFMKVMNCEVSRRHLGTSFHDVSLVHQGVGSDLLVRDPGLPHNLDIIPRVPRLGVTSSRTALHLAAVRALAARPEVLSFCLSLPSPVSTEDFCELLSMLGTKLTSLEVQQVTQHAPPPPPHPPCAGRAAHASSLEGQEQRTVPLFLRPCHGDLRSGGGTLLP